MKTPGLLFLLLLIGQGVSQAQSPGPRPRIGLTLSGGGAKGLAHIGLLQALDSAGVPVDYVTGTSMGAIVGSLYAAGYSGADIKRVIPEINWSSLLTNAAQLRTITLAEKDDIGRYLVELPFMKGTFGLPTGVIESEELWLKLSELHFPYYQTKDFARYQRGFRCVATDVLSGEPVVLKQGEIVSAVRASMAIPSIFTPVLYQGHRLVDGGLVRNFPVSEVKEMGAGIVIGSSVAAVAFTDASLRSPLDVLLQISSFKDNADFQNQKALCDVYVDYPLVGYSAGSFADAAPITAIGLRQGREAFPKLKRLVDSLDVLYGPAPPRSTPLRADSVYITNYQVQGLESQYVALLLDLMQFNSHRYYSPAQLSAAVRRAFGTRYFLRLTYTLQPQPDSSATIVFDVVRAPPTYLRFGLHYHSLTGIGLLGSISSKDWLFPFSTSQAALNLGENPRVRLKHFQYLTKSRKAFLRFVAQGEQVDVTTYDARLHKTGLYSQRYGMLDAQLLKELHRNAALGLGTRYEYVRFHPEITSQLQLKGRIQLLNSYVAYEANTLDAAIYPTQGRKVEAEIGYVYMQNPHFVVFDHETVVDTHASPRFSFQPYLRARLNYEWYAPLSSRSTLITKLQGGVNFNYRQLVVNDFAVGGLTPVVRNQITFAGLPETSLLTSSAGTGLLGYRYSVAPKLHAMLTANVLYHDFIGRNINRQPVGAIYGGALTLGYRSFLGPIDISLMCSDRSNKVLTYFNIGIPFGYR